MMDAARHFGTIVGFAAFAIVLILLGWQGNVGKGFACFVSPGTLEVIGTQSGSTTSGTNASTQSHSDLAPGTTTQFSPSS